MMPIAAEARLIIFALLAASIFGAGFSMSHAIDKAEIQRMELSILSANKEAAAKLKSASEKVAIATATAIKSNSELDASHEAFIKTAINYDQQLDSIRLYSERRPCSASTATTSDTSGISENATGEAELDAEIDRVIKEAAVIADIAADYAENAYKFANLNNCGIAKE